MGVRLRPGTPGDADAAGRICYDAFAAIATEHNFPIDFPSTEVAQLIVGVLLEVVSDLVEVRWRSPA
jgi:hypothetical protein